MYVYCVGTLAIAHYSEAVHFFQQTGPVCLLDVVVNMFGAY